MSLFFFFNDTATTEIYTLSLHDALPIWPLHQFDRVERASEASERTRSKRQSDAGSGLASFCTSTSPPTASAPERSEEHTSELQSRQYLVCRLLLEKKKKIK